MTHWLDAQLRVAELLPDNLSATIFQTDGRALAGADMTRVNAAVAAQFGGQSPSGLVKITGQQAGQHDGAEEAVLVGLPSANAVLEIAGPIVEATAVAKMARVIAEDALTSQATKQTPDETAERNIALAAIAASDSPIFARDLCGRYVISNPAHDRVWGVEDTGIVGLFDVSEQVRQSDQLIAKSRQTVCFEDTIETGGIMRSYIVRKFPVLDEAGEVFAVGCVASDVTEMKAREEKLRESEAMIQSIIDNAPAAILVKDLEGKYILSNRGHDQIWGFAPGELIGKTDAETYGPEYAEDYIASDQEILRDKVTLNFEDERDVQGVVKSFMVSKFPLLDAAGTPFAIGLVASDISELRQREETLRANEAKIQAIVDNMPAYVLVKNLQGIYELSNKANDALWGFDVGAVIGRSLAQVHGQDLAQAFQEADKDLMDTLQPQQFEYLHDIDGVQQTQFGHKFPLFDADGQLNAIGIVSTDISELKKREEELRESKALIQAIIDNMPAHVLIKDPKGTYLFSNKAHDTFWGHEPGSLIGKTTTEVHGPEMAAAFKEEDKKMLETLADESFEQQHLLNGQKTTWLGHRFPVLDQDGNLQATGIVSTDATKMRDREQALNEINDQVAASIHYAARIQKAMLPSQDVLDAALPNHFLIWEPRDIVGGDLYWVHQRPEGTYIVVGDCTGHGAPGAFMTLISFGVIDQHLRADQAPTPATLLAAVNADLKAKLNQTEKGDARSTDDGLEAGVCFIDATQTQMTFAGARFSLFETSADGMVREIRGDKAGLAFRRTPAARKFSDHRVDLQAGQKFYLSTDGMIDQVGGDRRIGFGKRRFTDLLKNIHDKDVTVQNDVVRRVFAAYQGGEHRRDDVTLLGFKLT